MGISQKAANAVKAVVGSWRYVILCNIGFFGWIVFNTVGHHDFDPYPYILLNLVLSYMAMVTGPLIMVSQNQQEVIQAQQQELQRQMLATILHLAESQRELLQEAAEQIDQVVEDLCDADEGRDSA